MSYVLRPVKLSGWGRSSGSVASFASVDPSDLPSLVDAAGLRGVTVRGLGRSYGDASQNGGGLVLQLNGDVRDVVLHPETCTLRSPAGVSLDALMAHLVPRGFFVPVTPGTRFVTVGGAVASDIHGKNHHCDGSFGSHVRSFTILLADGRVQEVSPSSDPDLFWATIGGMGLTGAILDVTFAVLPIETSVCKVSTRRYGSLGDLVEEMSVDDDLFKYSVAWTDLLSRGSSMGRSILWRGDHARRDEISDRSGDLENYRTRRVGTVPPIVPSPGLVNRFTSGVFNALWFHSSPKSRSGQMKTIPSYFHPLDSVADWNRLYGPRGFVQYQFVVPFGAEETLRSIVEDVSDAEIASPLVVLKRFGDSNEGHLSFPSPGWTLTVDIPARSRGLSELLSRLDDQVLEVGGRHYLAKDSHMTPETFRRGYPRFAEWRAVKKRVDPGGIWTSDLSRRLQLND